ncbi:succinate dehydrogenase, cytochrome b556 subunit [Pararhodobacter sp.]|uniref:succinate dehydrogenase, cytochrome b556 subunit n=1 Tax=Pararhodobacter sp. TaxID=2127056 RepID=UPI002FDC907B
MSDVNRGNRPLSPHLTVYRLPLTAILSILHRITGVGMVLAAVLIVWWFVAAVYSPEYFASADRLLTSWIGTLVLTASLWALWYHFCNGIRHLFWDAGMGFDLAKAERNNWIILGGSVVLTVLTLIIA